MSRINLLVAVAVAAGVVGCAQCDTCDDFPTPCTGPNCGHGGMPAYLTPPMGQGSPVMGASTPMAPPVDDAAGPGPVAPPATPSPDVPPADATSPPPPMEPAPR